MKCDLAVPRPMLQLTTSVRRQADLGGAERQQMYRLMADHFEGVRFADFERDLGEKEWVVTISEPERGIVGFTTAMQITAQVGGERVFGLFSGDTMLDPSAWGTSTWMRVLARHAEAMMRRSGEPRALWLLLTATHRTYRALPALFNQYYPRLGVATPRHVRERMDALVRLKFGQEYDPERGVVKLRHATPVRRERVPLVIEGLNNPHARFFAEQNPGFLNGDYLVCVAELSAGNRTRLGHRLFAEPVGDGADDRGA